MGAVERETKVAVGANMDDIWFLLYIFDQYATPQVGS